MEKNWRNNYVRYRGFFLDIITTYKKKPEVMMFLELILTFLTITLLSIFALKPTLITISSLVKEIKSKEELIAKMDKKLRDLTTAQNLVFAESRRIALLDSAIPSSPEVDVLSAQIEGIAANTSDTLTNFSVDEVALKESAQAPQVREKNPILPPEAEGLTLTVRAANDFATLKTILSQLENMRRPVLIESLNFAQSDNSDQNPALTLTITGQVPYKPKEVK